VTQKTRPIQRTKDKRLRTHKAMKNSRIVKLIGIGLLAIGLFNNAFGQQHTENKADQTLRGSGRVNPSTLGMEFDLPLGSYSGRGINVPIGLSYSSKVWRMDFQQSFPRAGLGSQGCIALNQAKYAENSASGWTTSMQEAYVEYTGLDNFYTVEGFPLSEDCYMSGSNNNGSYIRRIQIHLPSGESHELRMNDTPVIFDRTFCTSGNVNCDGNPTLPHNWNGWYYAVDGSNLRYFEDRTNNSFILQYPDGSQYSFENNFSYIENRTIRKATLYKDRNGNKTTYHNADAQHPEFPNGYWLDTMGKAIGVPLPNKAPITAGIQDYKLPGLNGGWITYKFNWKQLKGYTAAESGLTDFNQTLRYKGNRYLAANNPNGNPVWLSRENFIFGSQWGAYVLSQNIFNPIVLAEIELPTGQKYEFSYDISGKIERIYSPTGGEEHFVYAPIAPLSVSDAEDNVTDQANFGVVDRKVLESSGDTTPYQTTYSATYVAPMGYKVSTTNSDGTKSERYLHRGNDPCPQCNPYQGSFGYDNGLAGMPYQELGFDNSNQPKLVSKKLTHWSITAVPFVYGTQVPHWHPRVDNEETFIYDETGNGVSSTTRIEYEGDLSLKETPVLAKKSSQYAFVALQGTSSISPIEPENPPGPTPTPVPTPIPPTLLRTTETSYLQNDPSYSQAVKDIYKAQNIVGMATASVVKDAGGNVVSRSEVKYDEPEYSIITAASTNSNWDNPNTIYRGNPTTGKTWDSTKGLVTDSNAYTSTHTQFDNFGNLRKSWDAKGNLTETDFASPAGYDYKFAYPTKTKSPAVMVNGVSTVFEINFVYEPTTGLLKSTTDANGKTTEMFYDAFLRPIKTLAANGHQTITEYGAGTTESTRFTKVKTQIDTTNWKEEYSWYDGLGRTFKTQSVDSNGDVFTETEFDSFGRPWRSTNPYRNGEAKIWTTAVYDNAGRVKESITSDGAKVKTEYGIAVTGSQIGIAITVTDQALKQRRSITNALGQITRVDEPNDAGELGTIDAPNQPTLYTYDVLSNLITVDQGVQTRTFVYDSLSRLKTATNPESGTINYTYDVNNNLLTKTDARNIKTIHDYDSLNRIAKRCYTIPNPQGNPTDCGALTVTDTNLNTPAVTFEYDNVTNAKGSLTKVTTGNPASPFSTTEYNAFDIMGRVSSHRQTIEGDIYNTSYVYNLSGGLIEETYPSGRVVKTTLDTDGDLQQIQSKKLNGTFQNYANAFTYTSAGAISSMRLGNGKFENTQYNSRLQPTQIGLGSSATSQNLLKLEFNYGGSDNNGNVKLQTITTPTVGTNQGFTATQNYSYDSLNRLKSAVETVTGQVNPNWNQVFKYDRYGNREFETNNNNTTNLLSGCPMAICNPSANTQNNKLVGTNYDNAGNTTLDAKNQTFVYDAENKQVQVSNATAILGQYFYDGGGKRVKKVVPTTGETTNFVYDAGGKMVAEYSTISASATNAKVSYLTNDHLGSPRITTDGNGQVISRRDFQPFGEEIQRVNNGTDSIRKKFATYERDGETGLDYAQARYYSYQNGRFITVDPLMASAVITVTQSWNRYSYAANNPMRYNDPSGELPASFTKDQIRLFQTLVDTQNKRDGTSLTADQVWASLNASQQRTFIAVTHALENSFVTPKKKVKNPVTGKKEKAQPVSAISLVSGLKQVTGRQDGKKGTEQFRLLVSLTSNAVSLLRGSEEFKGGSFLGFGEGHVYKNGVVKEGVENVRQRGGSAKLQISYDENNLLEADIDVDYREYQFPTDPEGHNKPHNSDVNAVGPETSGGKPINNLERHNQTYGQRNQNPLRDLPTDPK
jgi:RHS repeat-associated protein